MYERALTESDAREEMDAAAAALPPCPGGFEGRGVVIPGGGVRYFPCAWVCLHMLREVGCTLPVELWHLGPGEMSEEMRRLVEPLGVSCVDGREVRRRQPVRILNGWELKCYAILNSRFREVLLLDADNFPLLNPAFLFDTPQYQDRGAVFWPDYGRLAPDRPIWRLAGVEHRDEPEFESGQIVVDKQRCWGPLSLAMWMNEHSDFWYQHVHGDKETFHLAWRKLGAEYAMPSRPIHSLPGVMCQHDFVGRRLFQHRNLAKWTLYGQNPRIPGFAHEEKGLGFLEHLRKRWAGQPHPRYDDARADPPQRHVARTLLGRRWLYRRLGHDQRPMTFAPDGAVREGADRCEQTWGLCSTPAGWELTIMGGGVITCILYLDDRGRWRGRWVAHERMPIELSPIGDDPVPAAASAAATAATAAADAAAMGGAA